MYADLTTGNQSSKFTQDFRINYYMGTLNVYSHSKKSSVSVSSDELHFPWFHAHCIINTQLRGSKLHVKAIQQANMRWRDSAMPRRQECEVKGWCQYYSVALGLSFLRLKCEWSDQNTVYLGYSNEIWLSIRHLTERRNNTSMYHILKVKGQGEIMWKFIVY